MCEEYESFHDETVKPVVGGQSSSSFVPSVIKTHVPLDCDDLARKDLLLQQCGERIEKVSQQDRLSRFCMDAGFLNVDEIGQYFMTKDTEEFSQFTDSVACREYTLPTDEKSTDPEGWIRGNTQIDQVQISFKQTTHHTSEAEASQKIIAGGQTLWIITERVIESSVIEENHRGFVTCKQQKHNCTFLSHPRKDSQVANLQQAHWLQLPQFFVSEQLVFFEFQQACHCSHAPIIGWAETAQFEEHDIMFTFDI